MGEQIEKLAQFIARTDWDDMPEAVHRRAKLVLLDTIGVTLAGAARPDVIGLSAPISARGCWRRRSSVIAFVGGVLRRTKDAACRARRLP